jgi:hypothetical protein
MFCKLFFKTTLKLNGAAADRGQTSSSLAVRPAHEPSPVGRSSLTAAADANAAETRPPAPGPAIQPQNRPS